MRRGVKVLRLVDACGTREKVWVYHEGGDKGVPQGREEGTYTCQRKQKVAFRRCNPIILILQPLCMTKCKSMVNKYVVCTC